jgi:peptidyl-prolyl cis-trans isomerase D
MLDIFRQQSASFLVYLIFGAIIVVFAVSFGPGSGSCRPASPNYAAIIDGEIIPQQEFYMDYSRQLESYRRRAQQANIELSNETIERLGLKRQVLDALVSKRLISHEAAKRGLTVSDDELVKHLETRYGVKDVTYEQYSNWVQRSFETTVVKFEASVRSEILGEKMERVVNEQVSVSDDELKTDFLREHDRAMVTFVKFDPAETLAAAPTREAVDKALKDEMPAIEAAYNEDIMKYRTPHRVQARQIVRKLPETASDAVVATVRGKLLELQSEITGGADFAALAKEFSEDPVTSVKGGELGLLERGQSPKEIEDAIFTLKKDEMAPPIRVKDALVLVQVTDVQPPSRKKLDDVKAEVAANLLKTRIADELAKQAADVLFAKLEKGEALDKVTASEAEAKEPAKELDKAPAKGGKLPAKAAAAAVKLPVRVDTAWVLKSQGAIPRIGASEELHAAVFSLTTERPLAKQVFKVGKSYFVVLLKDREIPDVTKFESDKDSLRQQALWAKRTRVYREWLNHLKQVTRIQYSPALFPTEKEAKS